MQQTYFETESLRETGAFIDRLLTYYESMGVDTSIAEDIAEFDAFAHRIIHHAGQYPASLEQKYPM